MRMKLAEGSSPGAYEMEALGANGYMTLHRFCRPGIIFVIATSVIHPISAHQTCRVRPETSPCSSSIPICVFTPDPVSAVMRMKVAEQPSPEAYKMEALGASGYMTLHHVKSGAGYPMSGYAPAIDITFPCVNT
nr:hypothetical protein CFP56_72801 [Quercus suber]